jgi:hypothetical protein
MALNSPEMVKSLMKHTNVDYDGFGTNSVNVNTALATMQQEERDYWALARSGASTHPQATPLQIWHPRLLTVVTGTYDTLAGQTVNPRYVQGELADQFWAWLQTQVGVAGGIDHVFDPWTGAGGTVRGSTDVNSVDYYKFAPNMTGDGTHVLAAGATIGGNNLRPVWDSFA